MPPAKRNPAAGKRPANAQTTSRTRAHTRNVNGKTVYVRASTRTINSVRDWAHRAWTSVNATRIRRTAAGTATAGTVSALILAEFGFTLVTTLAMAGIALLTGATVYAGSIAEKNRATMNGQTKRRAASKRKPTQRRRPSSRTTRRR